MHRPDKEDNWYKSKRVWIHSRHDWDPSWYQKLGWPHVGGDEWGRMAVTIGFGWIGYLSWAYRTCWKQCCHVSRQQTYELEAERWQEYQDKLTRGQCTCWNRTVWRHYFWYGEEERGEDRIRPPKNVQLYLAPSQRCDCGHIFARHDQDGDCQQLDGTAGTKGRVSLITGFSADDIDRLGGIEDES